MKNKRFFYEQYNKINWENQEKTKINSFIYNVIIKDIILKKDGSGVSLFDIGFGIGFFWRMLNSKLYGKYKKVTLAGCEPSEKNYNYFVKKLLSKKSNVELKLYKNTFQNLKLKEKFDFITAIYVYPHFEYHDLKNVAEKIYTMLNEEGKFILVVANEKYLKEKLKSKKDLSIESDNINFEGKEYNEILHYSDIPQIGKVID